jgi:hypothetical protein
VGGALPSQLTQDFAAIEQIAQKIQSYGCVVKEIHNGLLDFYRYVTAVKSISVGAAAKSKSLLPRIAYRV